ncbi:DUF2213 domain-containing protein [Caballeronia sp. INDeC2]|uniref:DUF2213 domain-containing protein n=1 Tax=Caballeronia sp. INDeC2 TaxID=2921747 RepID=UPI00202938E5|nr:DUF2213 domain-containing protein [Caballeronia sp. INDeC2]
MKFYATQQLGPKRSMTPEGYLVCKDVPVARTGDMTYAPGEVPIAPGPDGLIHITRDADEVFHPDTLASCEGKSVTVAHPPDFVNPDNVDELEVGLMMNIRRGSGIDSDLVLADLLIKRRVGIDAVLKHGVEQVSLGYDADYQQVSPGRGVQRGILVNHVALVPRGRCGPRCEIGDEETVMPTTDKKPSWLDGLKAFIKDAEAEGETEAEKEARLKKEKEDEEAAERKKTGDALSMILQKLTTLDADVQALKKGKTGDEETAEEKEAREKKEKAEKEGKTDDETIAGAESQSNGVLSDQDVLIYTGDSAALIPARAEILAPGIKLATFDSAKASTKDTAAHLCACQRRALAAAHKTDDGKAVLTPLVGTATVDFDKMPPMAVNAIFTSAAEAMRAKNNAGGGKGATIDLKPMGKMSVTDSIRKMQENANKMWAGSVQSK